MNKEMSGKVEHLKGRVKQAAGAVTGDKELEALLSGQCDAIVSTPPESIEAHRKGCHYVIDFAEYGLNYALGGIAARRVRGVLSPTESCIDCELSNASASAGFTSCVETLVAIGWKMVNKSSAMPRDLSVISVFRLARVVLGIVWR